MVTVNLWTTFRWRIFQIRTCAQLINAAVTSRRLAQPYSSPILFYSGAKRIFDGHKNKQHEIISVRIPICVKDNAPLEQNKQKRQWVGGRSIWNCQLCFFSLHLFVSVTKRATATSEINKQSNGSTEHSNTYVSQRFPISDARTPFNKKNLCHRNSSVCAFEQKICHQSKAKRPNFCRWR